MAGFRTHITTSTVLGVAYGGVAWAQFDVPLPACLLAGGLCSVSGMLPDLDSDSGVPLRESIAFAASVVPMLLVHRFQHMGLSVESMVLIGAGIYLAIRFGLSKLLKLYTVHRGMFHSLPAALIAAETGYLLCTSNEMHIRLFKAGGILLGFMSHLVLDEIWAISWKRGIPRFKKSFGTAIKFWGDSAWANFSAYAKLGLLSWVCFYEPGWMQENLARAYHGHPLDDEAVAAEQEEPGDQADAMEQPVRKKRIRLDDEQDEEQADGSFSAWLKKAFRR